MLSISLEKVNKMGLQFSHYVLLLVTFFNPILTLEAPECDHKGNICYKAPGRNCDGFKIQDNGNLDSVEVLFVEHNNLKIAIVKKELSFAEAILACNKMCGKLWAPQSNEFEDTYYGFSQTCNDHDIEKVFIGAISVKAEDQYYYKHLDDPSTTMYFNESKFTDTFLNTAMYFSDVGEYPLTIQTTEGKPYFNYWTSSNYQMKNYYACQSDITLRDESTIPTEKEKSFLKQLMNKFEFLASPKLDIPGTDMKLSLISYPRNAVEAINFCKSYSNGGTLYDIQENYLSVVQFAESHGIKEFFISLNDKESENKFVNTDGTILANDYANLWITGEPNNDIPDSRQFCDDDGEDFVIMDDGKLSDVNVNSRHSFFCQYTYKTFVINNVEQQCPPCKMLLDNTISLFTANVIPPFKNFCEDQLLEYFGSQTTMICSYLGFPLFEVIQYLKHEFIDTNEICSIYQNCHQNPIQVPSDTCSKCKIIIKELKSAIQGLQLHNFFGKVMPHIANFIASFCSDLGMKCQNLDIEKILKELLLFEPENEDVSWTFCIKFASCM